MTGDLLESGLAVLRDSGGDFAPLFREGVSVQLERYMEEIERYNPRYGLVGAKDRRELTVKHILDSLAPLGILSRFLEAGSAVADVGSGAGLPGIPLAIALRDQRFTLIEARQKRARFLAQTAAVLGLSNAGVEQTDMEQALPGRFRVAVFRAFKPLEPRLLRDLLRLLAPDGVLAAYKGKRDKISAEMELIENAIGKKGKNGKTLNPGESGQKPGFGISWEVFPLAVPFLAEERHLVIIRPVHY
jgi:16S rRNA (guanine527-N7)-methyltransferase